MRYSATLSGTTATITSAHNHQNSTSLIVTNASNLASELTGLLTDPDADPVNASDYSLVPTDAGVNVVTPHGKTTLPWRWIDTVVASLNA